jgi:hypothetical protein
MRDLFWISVALVVLLLAGTMRFVVRRGRRLGATVALRIPKFQPVLASP